MNIYFVYKIRNKALNIFWTFVAYTKATFWRIEIGKKCQFRGSILLYNKGKIVIGNKCRFNSIDFFNFRGINHRCIIQTSNKNALISIGENSGFTGVSIVADKEVIIGRNVLVGTNSTIGDRDDHKDRYNTESKGIYIEDDVWIGMDVTILKGVSIGKGAIIGAKSLVTKDIPANEVWAGIPAKFIKKIVK